MSDITTAGTPAPDVITMSTTAPTVIASPPAFEQSVHDDIDSAIAAIPPGKSNALFVDGTIDKASGPGLEAVCVHRSSDDRWKVAVSGAYDGPHGVEGKVQGVWAW